MSTQKAIDLSHTILKCPTPCDMIMDITHYITLVFSAQESLYKAFSSTGITLSYEDIFCIDVNKEKKYVHYMLVIRSIKFLKFIFIFQNIIILL
ncbi:hypothetical protein [Gilliamella sp. Pas-s95]|uniref:hypothetical protein n=1 Tax=Gilliamella sp. Pas-s95 TaxID=2687317 RepID=UPI001325C942|nr:hypothetical protein [Gilliamella sp. Pas-s95]